MRQYDQALFIRYQSNTNLVTLISRIPNFDGEWILDNSWRIGIAVSVIVCSLKVWSHCFSVSQSPNTLHFMIHWSHKSLVTLHFGLTDSLATMSMFLSVSVRRHDRRGQRVETALHRRAHEEIRGRLQRG